MKTARQEPQRADTVFRPFRLDVPLHNLLQEPEAEQRLAPRPPSTQPQKLLRPIFPQRPELPTNAELPTGSHGFPADPCQRHWTAPQVCGAMKGWMFPFLKSLLLPGDFHPIVAYAVTEWKGNLDRAEARDQTRRCLRAIRRR